MSAIENVFWGVVAGIITSAVLFTLGAVFVRLVIPWYQEKVYDDVDIGGKWGHVRQEGEATYHYRIKIDQAGHNLKGTASITRSGDNVAGYDQEFDVNGRVGDGFVRAVLRSSDRKRPAYAVALLQVVGRGNRLSGAWAYRTSDPDGVDTEFIQLEREA